MRIGLLNVFNLAGTTQGLQAQYKTLMQSYLANCDFMSEPLQVFEISQGQYPSSISDCDGWVIGGSAKSCYDQLAWIEWLKDFVQQIDRAEKKLLGICFGHQLIAQSLGGQVCLAEKGWGLGVKDFRFYHLPSWHKDKETGLDFGAQPKLAWLDQCALIFSHQDQVIQLPKRAQLLAGSDHCPVQSFIVGEHILTLQGHPEFTQAFAMETLEGKKKLVEPSVVDKAKASFSKKTHEREIGYLIKAFFTNQNPLSEA